LTKLLWICHSHTHICRHTHIIHTTSFCWVGRYKILISRLCAARHQFELFEKFAAHSAYALFIRLNVVSVYVGVWLLFFYTL